MISTGTCISFKDELLKAGHDFLNDVFKLALIKTGSAGTFDKNTTNYSDLGADEVANGNGYTTGGKSLLTPAVNHAGDISYVDWADLQWTAATFNVRGLLIYNSSKSNKAVAVWDFGADVAVVADTFDLTLPPPGAGALVRLGG